MSGLSTAWFDKFLAHGQTTMTVHNYRPRQFHRTSNRENPSRGYRDMGSASLAAACPPAQTMTTIPLQPGGLRGKRINDALLWMPKTGCIQPLTNLMHWCKRQVTCWCILSYCFFYTAPFKVFNMFSNLLKTRSLSDITGYNHPLQYIRDDRVWYHWRQSSPAIHQRWQAVWYHWRQSSPAIHQRWQSDITGDNHPLQYIRDESLISLETITPCNTSEMAESDITGDNHPLQYIRDDRIWYHWRQSSPAIHQR